SIVLGLMAYFGYADQDRLSKDNQDLKAKLNGVSIDRDSYKLLYSVAVVASGTGNPKEEAAALGDIQGLKNKNDKSLNGKTLNQTYKDELDKLSKKGVKWGDVDEKPDTTFAARLAQLEKDYTNSNKLNVDKDTFIKRTTEDFQKDLAAARDGKTKAEKEMA